MMTKLWHILSWPLAFVLGLFALVILWALRVESDE